MPCEDGALKRYKIAVAWSYRDDGVWTRGLRCGTAYGRQLAKYHGTFSDKKEWAEEEP